ncbi:tetratricopeptide repeat protein [Kribbella voronezhensis]|uniref:Tetratricopeptide repeat protein n=1 Tax=Kribbella voronezhensis TaxID=2512212 RepID=A0A4V3FKU3_9ACTN|nr:XRE family transcriptional regulator [Kribbella voronezhensis]TDU91513.1 tetratricopeptide repeat protein [Kribbella voronezhensis]
MPTVAELLRHWRTEAGLTQEALADRSGLSVEGIRALEGGRRLRPRPTTIEQLSAALELPEHDVLRLEELAGRPATAPVDHLPAGIGDFTGRSEEIGDLLRILSGTAGPSAGVVLVSVAGMGGVGKTALAVHTARRLAAEFPDGQLYVGMGGHAGGEPLDPLVALGRLLRDLGIPDEEIPDNVDIAAARYRSALAGRRVLVLIDDAVSSSQVRPLIPGTAGSAVLITTRRQLIDLAGIRQLKLDVLTSEDAVRLLAAVVGDGRVEQEPQAARAVTELCGRLPLALRIAGSYLAGRPGRRVEELARELDDEEARLAVLSTDDKGVRASLKLSIDALAADHRSMAQTAARALPVISILPGTEFSLRFAAAALGIGMRAAEDAIEHLVDVHLLETPALHRYRLHDLVRSVGRELADAELGESGVQAVQERVLAEYLALLWRIDELSEPGELTQNWRAPEWSEQAKDIAEAEQAIELVDADRATLVSAVRVAESGPPAERLAVVRIAAGMNAFGLVRRRWVEWRDIGEAAIRVLAGVDDDVAAAMIHFDLGLVYGELQEHAAAAEHLGRAAPMAAALGDRDFERSCLLNLAHALERAGELSEAKAVIARLISTRPEPRAESWAELVLGMIAGKEHDHAAQMAAFERSVALFRQDDPPARQLAMRYRVIGESLEETGRYAEAETLYRDSLAAYREEKLELMLAEILGHLGRLLVTVERFDEAAELYAESLQLAITHELWDSEAAARVGLGRWHQAAGRPGQAVAEWQQALAIYRRYGSARADEVQALLEDSDRSHTPR